MRERIAGCLICIVAMLAWEALSASSHEAVRAPSSMVEAGPLVELSAGIVGARSAQPTGTPGDQVADAAVFEWVEDLLPVVATPCEPVVVATCDEAKPAATSAAHTEDDAGVGPSAASLSSVTPSGKPG